jgi:hypothetical protein
MGIFALLFFLLTEKQGRAREGAAAALVGRPRHGGGREGRGKEEGRTGNGFPSSISEEGPRREGSHGGGRRCRAWRRPGLGEKEEGDGGTLFPHSPWTGVQRSVLATGAGGGGESLLGQRC